jgi:DNA integrity scanning protein DisA with diadenylate cyclase activity
VSPSTDAIDGEDRDDRSAYSADGANRSRKIAEAPRTPVRRKLRRDSESFRGCPTRNRRLRLDEAQRTELNSGLLNPEETPHAMPARGISERLNTLLATARRILNETESDAILFLAEWPLEWESLVSKLGHCKLVVAASDDVLAARSERTDESASAPNELDGIRWVRLDESDGTTRDRLTMALLEAVADEHLRPGASVVALYRGFDEDEIDSLSVIRLDEHLENLTAADLRKLETRVPLETLKAVVDLAVEIGREGREGHPVGTMFVVGDHVKVMKQSRPMGFDPFHGYSAKEKSLRDRRVREELKEIAQLDGAFIINSAGDVVAARRYIDSPATGITMSKGLGSRHWAAAAVSKATKAIAVVVSQSSGTVRIFQNGQIMLRIEPLRRAMKWQEFESQPPPQPPEWLA